jgi:hypothetical protein
LQQVCYWVFFALPHVFVDLLHSPEHVSSAFGFVGGTVNSFIIAAGVFDSASLVLLIWILLTCGVVAYFSYRRHVSRMRLRTIPGIAAIEEAVGRATEQGRPIVFTTGWGGDIQRPTTLAALNLLRFVAGKAASYGCRILFPTHDPVIAEAAKEIIRTAYNEAGHPDQFREDDVTFVSPSQFGYASGVDGIVSREKPGAIFLFGTFEGEALILAETGNINGALQIAGTDSTIQLSFFIIACDYTLIGEELFTASAYLTDDQRVRSSMYAQDLIRAIVVTLLILLPILAMLGVNLYEEIL